VCPIFHLRAVKELTLAYFYMERATKEQDEDVDPLPKVAYATLKDRQLKELLSTYDLSSTGGRESCIRRHERYALIPRFLCGLR
jgi:hypothetical protein